MGRAKDIVLKVIPATIAIPFVKAHHYSGSVVGNSKLHFGVYCMKDWETGGLGMRPVLEYIGIPYENYQRE
jgi:hypothetical protein